MSAITWTLRSLEVSALTDYSKNPRNLTKDQFAQLKKSLDKFGLIDKPIINLDSAHTVIGGHQRLHVLRAEGVDAVECWIPNRELTAKEVEELNIRLNKNTGGWDFDVLANSWELPDLLEWGFTEKELELGGFDFDQPQGEDPGAQIDKAEELRVKWGVELGQLWKLGEHRLICGDCTDRAVVDRVMGGEKAELVFTDPPYRMEAEGGSNQVVGKAARKLGEAIKELCDFDPNQFLEMLPRVFDGNMNAYIFCNKDLVLDYLQFCKSKGYSFNILFWKKPSAIPLGGSHRPDVEYLILARKNAVWNNAVSDANYSRCLEFGRESENHPTTKPLELVENELKISSTQKGVVVDFFSGSGTTLIACERLSRKCRAVEISPAYCAVAIQRWVDMCGGTPELVSTANI